MDFTKIICTFKTVVHRDSKGIYTYMAAKTGSKYNYTIVIWGIIKKVWNFCPGN